MALAEVWHSREGRKGARSVYFVRIFEGLKTDFSEGAGGWTASGLPVIGDAYPYCTWSSKVTPRCISVDVDPRFTGYKARVVATYSTPRILGD